MYNQAKIDSGRLLKELRDKNEAFSILRNEMTDRIAMAENVYQSLSPRIAGPNSFIDAACTIQTLRGILTWLDDEINDGEKELTAKREEDLQEARI